MHPANEKAVRDSALLSWAEPLLEIRDGSFELSAVFVKTHDFLSIYRDERDDFYIIVPESARSLSRRQPGFRCMYKTALRLVDAAALFVLLPAAAGTRIVSSGFFVHVNGNIIQIVIRDKSFYMDVIFLNLDGIVGIVLNSAYTLNHNRHKYQRYESLT